VTYYTGVKRITLGGLACLAVVSGVVTGCGWNDPAMPKVASVADLTEGQRQVQYSYYVHELVPCMRALRFRVDRVPELEEFLSQVPVLAWSPWNALRSSASSQELARIRTICPPNPIETYPTPLPIREVAVTGRQLSRSIGG
jgi:hypothetical protein